MGRLTFAERRARLDQRIRALRLHPLLAALLGAAGGLLVGGAMTLGMVRNATFTGPHQDVTAGAILLALWLAIGLIAGLAVLSPLDGGDGA
jgi:hypothetical protein